MKLQAAAIQMTCAVEDINSNLERADALLGEAHEQGVELAVLPEMFNTGYGFLPDFAECAECTEGPTLQFLRDRSRRWGMTLAAGFVEREGHHLYDSLALVGPDLEPQIYRKRHLVFWERFRFRPGRGPVVARTRWGHVGLAICADMIYKHVWEDYRDRIDVAIVSAAWPDFACRETGRRHWLFGHVGPLCGEIPHKVASDLGVPVVFSNQCGPTRTSIPLLGSWVVEKIADRFSGQSAVVDGRHGPGTRAGCEEQVVLSPITLHTRRGSKPCHFTFPSAPAVSSSGSARS